MENKMDLNEIIAALEKSEYECLAGALENSVAFIALKEMSNNLTMCCQGPNHTCTLNVNDGYCIAQTCIYQVQEKTKKAKSSDLIWIKDTELEKKPGAKFRVWKGAPGVKCTDEDWKRIEAAGTSIRHHSPGVHEYAMHA